MRRDGRGRGAGVVTATALVCALGVLAVPEVAYAAPGDPEPSRDGRPSLEEVHKQVEALYRQAEAATDAYNLARDKQTRQEKTITKIARQVVKARGDMAELKKQAGAMARAQYRNGAMPPEAQLLLSDDPQEFLDGVSLARKGRHATSGLINRLAATQALLDQSADSASREWQRLDQSRAKKAAASKQIKEKLKKAERLESKLKKDELERLRKLEEEKARSAQSKWLSSGILDDVKGKASPSGGRAVNFATAQIGKDYVWGAEGPDTYDCSGLTLKAWAAGGRAIPRTSQEQWKQLSRVEIEEMRPGDLIIYFGDASHVGMYVGDGMIVHAPRPGRQITLAGAGSMPILGVVRPDK
ncbi:C40 family peptidase [Streptomyces sp. XD-27]|uniref:C40 family peptidase n=1 Tax=Streptomyces sp. XD-27 TaxID=3062779 RepID=UPI0026F414A4|nr:C40 family peptidase [Streptomyces sp. XD-27]WKX71168.1 NlpC/P60 family protein [Streptomyces sp. XD-27]